MRHEPPRRSPRSTRRACSRCRSIDRPCSIFTSIRTGLPCLTRSRPPGRRARLPAHARAARALDPRGRLAALRGAGSRRDRVRVRKGGTSGDRVTLRIGVVGGGLVAQAMHLPTSRRCSSTLRARRVAEPSETVRSALGARYGLGGSHADYRALLDAGGLDAVLIASPRRHTRRGDTGCARRRPARLRREAHVHHPRGRGRTSLRT